MGFADEARAVHHVGLVFEDRLEQPRILGRVVFEVGVLHDDHVAGRAAEALTQRGALALVVRLVENANVALGLQFFKDGARAVGAAIFDDDDLFRDRHSPHAPHHLADPSLLVVDRNDHGQLEAFRDGIYAELAAGGFAE